MNIINNRKDFYLYARDRGLSSLTLDGYSKISYDYINDYIYIFPTERLPASPIEKIDSIIIESVFEHPTEVKIKSGEGVEYNFLNDDDEWFIPEDMIEQLKDIIIKRNLINNHRETDEIPNVVKVN